MTNLFYKSAVLADRGIPVSQKSPLKAFALHAAPFLGAAGGHVAVFVLALAYSRAEPNTTRFLTVVPAVTFVESLPRFAGDKLPRQHDGLETSTTLTKTRGVESNKIKLRLVKSGQAAPQLSTAPQLLTTPRLSPNRSRPTSSSNGTFESRSFDEETRTAVIEAAPDYPQNEAPPYPQAARRAGQEGVVELFVVVGADGAAESVNLSHSSDFPALDNAALVAVSGWRFKPAEVSGIPSRSTILVPVRFELRKK